MSQSQLQKFPFYGWIGIILILVFWFLNWHLKGLRTHWGFFPLWLGFILTVDALVFYRKGSSLIIRSFKKFVLMFFISIPVWWLFEIFNRLTQNWFYEGRDQFSDLEYFLFASLCFSTVIPAVLEAAELAGTVQWIKNLKSGPRIEPNRSTLILFFSLGLITLVLEIIFPKIFYFLIWTTVYFLVEPLNSIMGHKNLFSDTKERNWRPAVALCIGCLICGFFWEMWNYHSYPKWYYYLPGANVFHVFEMPALGYLGYIPFSLEVFAVYNFIAGLFSDRSDYVQLEGI